MSGAVPLAIEALVELIPVVQALVQTAKSGQTPTADDIAVAEMAIDKANAAIQAA